MEPRPDTIAPAHPAEARRAKPAPGPPETPGRSGVAAACTLGVLLACLMTWPLVTAPGRLGRTTTMDGLYSIWNVAWVARTIGTRPFALFDANIFSPHRNTLAYSEANLVAGIVAIPAWLLTGNAYAAHSSALLFAFASTFVGMWLLLRQLTNDAASAVTGSILFAFCPYFYSHTAHIQLLMAGGIPLSMLALHRLADAPSPGKGLVLGVALAIQGLACAYYGIFAGLMVGYAVLFFAATRRLWRDQAFWTAVVIAAATAGLAVLPFFVHYIELQRTSGFARSIEDAQRYAATWQSYLASPAHAHQPILRLARNLGWRMGEVLFPGVLAIVLGVAGIAMSLGPAADGSRARERLGLYGSLAVLACWVSFGPSAGLYTAFYRFVPLFTFLRAPSRFGVLLAFVLAIFAAMAVSALLRRTGRRRAVAYGMGALALLELNVVPFPWGRALPVSTNYTLLAAMPRGVVAEFPFYGERMAYPLHAQYMVLSTSHWMPLVNGYSDYIPPDFREAAFVLDSFPSNDTFAVLQKHRVRYIGIHWDMYGPRAEGIREQLKAFAHYLRPLGSDQTMSLYEIVSFP
jgi:hypothetical protein